MTTTVIALVLAGGFLVAYLMRRRARLRWLRGTTTSTNLIPDLIFKSTALAMASMHSRETPALGQQSRSLCHVSGLGRALTLSGDRGR